MVKGFGLHVHESDNVATVFDIVPSGGQVSISDKRGMKTEMTAKSEIPYGHKIAMFDISKGEKILKYGQVIGRATDSVQAGDHVHVQNMESLRGRGDFSDEEWKELRNDI